MRNEPRVLCRWPEETSWEITPAGCEDPCAPLVARDYGNPLMADDSLQRTSFVLVDGDYKLTVLDSYGDGLQVA